MPRELLWVLAGGAALAAAFPKPDLHLFVWIAICPLLVAASATDPWTALRYGLAFGMVFRAGNLYWVVHAMTEHGGLALPVAVLGTGLLAAYLAAYWGLFALVVQQVGLRRPASVLLTAACWTGLEYFQGWFMTGFPWTPIGYAAGRSNVLIQLGSLGGVPALTFLAVLVNAAVAAAWMYGRRSRGPVMIAVAGLVIALTFGVWTLAVASESPDRLAVGVVQGNVAQGLKWEVGARREILDRHVELSRRAAAGGARVVFWPESSWPDPYGIERDPAAYDLVAEVARTHSTAIVVGTVRVTVTDNGYEVANAAVLVDQGGEVGGAYEKSHLVPFGEYLPFRPMLGWLGPLVQAVGELKPGTSDQRLLGGSTTGLPTFGMSICYEIIFAAMARDQVRRGARFLSTITNDAWYGTTSGPYQHFAMARMRAVENRRWLVRAANTGISGAVDPWGRVVIATALEETAAPVVEIGLRTDTTFYQRSGDILGMICQLFAALLVVGALRGRPVFAPAVHPV
jgi:apolipoprotein N-acyltransferase